MNQISSVKEFEDLINSNEKVIIDFFAIWCGPCKMLSPIVEEIANEHPEISFVKVDVDNASELASMFGVSSIPTLAFIKDKRLVGKEVGFMPKNDLDECINNYLK